MFESIRFNKYLIMQIPLCQVHLFIYFLYLSQDVLWPCGGLSTVLSRCVLGTQTSTGRDWRSWGGGEQKDVGQADIHHCGGPERLLQHQTEASSVLDGALPQVVPPLSPQTAQLWVLTVTTSICFLSCAIIHSCELLNEINSVRHYFKFDLRSL